MESTIDNTHLFTGVVLAGGQARRMNGQDKGLIELAGKPLVQYALTAIKPQVCQIKINANRNLDKYAHYNYPVIEDQIGHFSGPLAGMASCLETVDTPFMVTVPCDSPFIPEDLVQRLYQQLLKESADISVAHNGERIQPVFTLIKKALYESIINFLQNDERKIDRWFELHNLAITDFSDQPDTFININTREDLSDIELKLEKRNSR